MYALAGLHVLLGQPKALLQVSALHADLRLEAECRDEPLVPASHDALPDRVGQAGAQAEHHDQADDHPVVVVRHLFKVRHEILSSMWVLCDSLPMRTIAVLLNYITYCIKKQVLGFLRAA